MFRSYLRPFVVLLSALLLVGLAAAQGAANLPAQAVVSYANLLTPGLVTELQPLYSEPDDLAFAIINRYIADGVVSQEIAGAMQLALTTGVLPQETIVMFLADVYNGTEPAPESLAAALAQLGEAGISVPVADENGNVSEAALVDAVTEAGNTLVANPNNPYNDAVTRITGN